jgi:hypothetical protein
MEYEIQQLIDELKQYPSNLSYVYIVAKLEEILEDNKYNFPL